MSTRELVTMWQNKSDLYRDQRDEMRRLLEKVAQARHTDCRGHEHSSPAGICDCYEFKCCPDELCDEVRRVLGGER